MKFTHKTAITLTVLSSTLCFFTSSVYADIPDTNQNSGLNNIAYDLKSKMYIGMDLSYPFFDDTNVNFLHQTRSLSNNSVYFGFFAGYKVNNYFAAELNYLKIGELQNGNSSLFPLSYDAKIYNVSLDALASYSFIIKSQYKVSVFGKAGYGVNITKYNYNLDNGYSIDSGSLNHGAYNIGLGLNFDFSSNISTRFEYDYYQAYYPMPNGVSAHNPSVLVLGLYYNFS